MSGNCLASKAAFHFGMRTSPAMRLISTSTLFLAHQSLISLSTSVSASAVYVWLIQITILGLALAAAVADGTTASIISPVAISIRSLDRRFLESAMIFLLSSIDMTPGGVLWLDILP
jgi:hypothetical protein